MQGKDGTRDNDNRLDALVGKFGKCGIDLVCVPRVYLQ
jgi:hypothetical protein